MKRPDLSKFFARIRTHNITFDKWLKASRPRSWVVFVASVIAAMVIEDLTIYLGAPGALHVVFAIPAFYVAAEAYLSAAKGEKPRRWQRGLILLVAFFLILGPTPADLGRELHVAILAAVVALIGVGAFIGFSRAKTPTIKRRSASHMTKEGKPKVAFATEAEARVVADSMTARDGAAMNTYVCGECRQWHIGHAR